MGWSVNDQGLVALECQQGTVHWFHGAKLVAPSLESDEEQVNLAMRIVCHILIDYVSDEGLPEACQSLREFYEYYKPTRGLQRYLPEVRQVEAEMGKRLVRPAFSVEGE